MKISTSSDMYLHLDLASACAQIKKAGCAGVDLWSSPRMCEHITPQSRPEEIRRIVSESGLEVAALTAYHTLSPAETLDRFLWSVGFAADVGAPCVVTNGADWKGDLRSFAGHLAPALKLAEERKVRIAFENHSSQSFSGTQADLMKVADEIRCGSFGFTIAPAHLTVRGADVADTIRQLRGRVFFFYAWDHVLGEDDDGRQFRWPPPYPEHQFPGKGRLDFRSYIAGLRETGYEQSSAGWLNIRSYPRYCREPWETERITAALKESAQYLCELAAA